MNKPQFISAVVALSLFAGVLDGNTADPRREGERLFALKVKRILSAKCFSCHGAEPGKIKGELNLTTRHGLLKGGESESPGFVPGKPEESLIVQAVERQDKDLAMPPKAND